MYVISIKQLYPLKLTINDLNNNKSNLKIHRPRPIYIYKFFYLDMVAPMVSGNSRRADGSAPKPWVDQAKGNAASHPT